MADERNCKLVVRQWRWDKDLQMLIEIPLDDCTDDVIDFAREVAGKLYTDDEVSILLRSHFDTDI